MPDEPGRTILDNIVAARRRTLEETRLAFPLRRVQQLAEARQERRDFAAALAPAASPGTSAGLRVIADSSAPRLPGGCCGSNIAAARLPRDTPPRALRRFPC